MKLFAAFIFLLLTFNAFAQKPDDVLATANGRNYTAKDLKPEAQAVLANLPRVLNETRQSLLEEQISEILFEKESAAQKTTIEKIIEREVKSKIPQPTEREIQAVYDANRDKIGSRSLQEVRPQIVAYLTSEPERKAFTEFISNLKAKYKVALGKDVNAPNLTRFEVLATVGDKQISVENYDAHNRVTLSEIEIDAYEQARESLRQAIFSDLLLIEAKAQNADASDLLAREITDKLKDYTDTERANLESAFRERLFKKYNARILLKEVAPIVQTVSTDKQPTRGRADAPVTVVMFSDFQCSACSAVHPVLQTVLKSYGEKIRFVVRDFPLVQIHANAYRAALAANAANAQNRFFQYTEILYANQDKLDDESLIAYAARLNLNAEQFEADFKGRRFAADIERDIADGKALGIHGTPTVYVNGVKVRELSEEGFRQAIERALKK